MILINKYYVIIKRNIKVKVEHFMTFVRLLYSVILIMGIWVLSRIKLVDKCDLPLCST